MRLNWKLLRWALCSALVLAAAGCSGINTSHSISPASFLLPGLLQADPPPAQTAPIAPATLPVQEAGQS